MALPTAPAPAGPLTLGRDPKRPHFAYPHQIADIVAIQAIHDGTANEDQQKRGLRWIMGELCMTYDDTFHPDSERASIFMQGRRFVGLRLVRMLNQRVGDLLKRQEKLQQGD